MTTTQLNLIAPLEAPLPSPPEGEPFTESQWTTLMAIADTVIARIEVSSTTSTNSLCLPTSDYARAVEDLKQRLPSGSQDQLVQLYLRENASSIPGFRELLRRTVANYVNEDAKKAIRVVLSALE